MKKLIAVVLAIAMLASISGVVMASKPEPNPSNPVPGTDFNGPHYNLNILGKVGAMPGDYDNGSRHTIFIPLVTTWETNPCLTTGTEQPTPGWDRTVWDTYPAKGVSLRMAASPDGDFHVLDGNAIDDRKADFLIPYAEYGYDVFVSAKGKPAKEGVYEACMDIDAYYWDGDNYEFIGHADVDRSTGKPQWQNVKWLLYDGNVPYFSDELEDYFWQLYNNGVRNMQVRFYPSPAPE